MNALHLGRGGFALRYLTLFGGEAFSKLCVLAAFAYLSRVLPPAEFGLVELALSITVFFVLGVESGMGMYGARLVAATPADLPAIAARIMLLRLLYGLPAYGVLLIVASRYGDAGSLLVVYGLVVLLTPMFVQWAFQGLRQMQWVAAGTALRNFVFVGLVLTLVRPDSDLRLVGLAEVGGAAALAVFNLVVLRWKIGVRLDLSGLWAGTKRLFRDVWYLGASDMTWACLWYAPGVIVGWMLLERTEQVAWIGAAVRIVLSLHTFVWLYFFNLLPNLTLELAQGLENWRELVQRSLRTSMWPAGLIAVAGTVVAPRLMPTIYGGAFEAAVVPFQIIIWMIPVTWLSGHFRYTLIASGHQRWEAAASAATAVVTVTAAVILVPRWEAAGAAAALLMGGVANTGFAIAATNRYVGALPIAADVQPVVLAMAAGLVTGALASGPLGPIGATSAACVVYGLLSLRSDNELLRRGARWRRG